MEVEDRVFEYKNKLIQNNTHVPKALTWLHNFLLGTTFAVSTIGFMPICNTVAELHACSEADPLTGARHWSIHEEIPCYEGNHLIVTIVSSVLFGFTVPFAYRLAVVGGDATKLNSDPSLPFCRRLVGLLCKSWVASADMPRPLQVGSLTIASKSNKTIVQLTSVSVSLVLAFVSALAQDPMVKAVIILLCTLLLLLSSSMRSVYTGWQLNAATVGTRLSLLFSSVMALITVVIDDSSVAWPVAHTHTHTHTHTHALHSIWNTS